MIYAFTDAPIVSARVDRRTSQQKRIAAEQLEKRRRLQEKIYSVDELIKIGFYNKDFKQPTYGVEVWTRNCTLRDALGEWEQVRIPTLALCLPHERPSKLLESLRPNYWEESQAYYWGFRQRGNVAAWCIFDLLSRLLELPHWDKYPRIPLRWRLGNQKLCDFAAKIIPEINETGIFPHPHPKIIWGGSLAKTRHESTPYDYEWQTGKRTRDNAKEFWNSKILEQCPQPPA